MKLALKRTHCLVVGIGLAVGAAMSAVADDTELFVSDGGAGSSTTRPNILFIIDTSLSMNTDVVTQEAFDPDETYSGSCDQDRVYWTTNNSVPNCSYTSQWFPAAQNYCQASIDPLHDNGQYSNDYLLAWSSYFDEWRTLGTYYQNKPVECYADRGVHGNGGSDLYISDGANGPWYSDTSGEPAWTTDYTLFSANWLNWNSGGGATSTKSRLEIVQEVTNNILDTLTGVNVGLMKFNWDAGGPVVHQIENVATSRSDIQTAVDNLYPWGFTPLSETMYEAAQYFMGRDVVYGDVGPTLSVAASRTSGTIYGDEYKSPVAGECQKNYIVYLTDGEPTYDSGADSSITSLPGWSSTMGSSTCDGSGDGKCLDDLAEYLYKHDLDPNDDVKQNVVTNTIGFTVDLPLLASTAERGGGEYYLADDTASLTATLTEIVLNVLDDAQTFTAPAVPVNAFNRTQNLRDVFVSVFEPSNRVHWPGNLKKYRLNDGVIEGQDDEAAVDDSTGYFKDGAWSYWSSAPDGYDVGDGGAAEFLPDPASRNVYTNVVSGDLNASGNRFIVGNNDITATLIGAPDADRDDVINWARGVDVNDEDRDEDTTDTRHAMGDPLHANPVTLIYGGTADNPDLTVFVTTNDGYLHAIDPDDGSELWTFIPTQVMGRLYDLYQDDTTSTRSYGLDGTMRVSVFEDEDTGDERAILYFGMRRGGNTVFALEVTDRNDPQLLWTISPDDTGFEDLGETWSTPVVTKVKIDDTERRVAIFGGGYDNGQDAEGYRTDNVGNAVYMVDALTGELLWSAGNGDSYDLNLSDMEHSIPAALRVVDLNQNGLADRMYVGDMGGRVWRFDIFNGNSASELVEGGVLATLGAADIDSPDNADVRRFYAEPDVVPVVSNGHVYLTVNLGSGHRAHPLDDATDDWFFSIRDFNVFNKLDSNDASYSDPVQIDDLVDVTSSVDTPVAATDDGWRLEMNAGDGEKVLGPAITFDGAIHFTSFTPGIGTNSCVPGGGLNRLYAVAVEDGDPTKNFDTTVDDDELTEEDRSKVLAQRGIAPDPILLFPEDRPDNPVLCIGVECEDAQFDNFPAKTIWSQDGAQ